MHPLGKSPVLEITPVGLPGGGGGAEPIKLAESGYITQYLMDHFGQNKPSLTPKKWKDGQEGKVGGETDAFARFQYLLHYVEGSFFPNLAQYLFISGTALFFYLFLLLILPSSPHQMRLPLVIDDHRVVHKKVDTIR